jgi:hypothetical protein
MVLGKVPDLNTSLLFSTGNDTFISIRMVHASIAWIEQQFPISSDIPECPVKVSAGIPDDGHRALQSRQTLLPAATICQVAAGISALNRLISSTIAKQQETKQDFQLL